MPDNGKGPSSILCRGLSISRSIPYAVLGHCLRRVTYMGKISRERSNYIGVALCTMRPCDYTSGM